MCNANHHLHGNGEKNGAKRRTKVSFGRTMMLALEQSEGISSKLVRPSVEIKKILKFHILLMDCVY